MAKHRGLDHLREALRQRIREEGLRPFSARSGVPAGQLRSVGQDRASMSTTLESIASVLGLEFYIGPPRVHRPARPVPLAVARALDLSPDASGDDAVRAIESDARGRKMREGRAVLQALNDSAAAAVALTSTLSNATGARLKQAHATGTIGAGPVPAALAARFGRATAEHVVDHVQYRMAAPRGAGFRARFAGKETEHGNDRNIALELLNGLGERLVGTQTAEHGRSGAEPWRERGGNLPGLAAAGRDILDDAELELNRRRRGSVFSVWSRTSRSSFGGRHQALALNGDVRTTMIGADYTRGRLTTGVSMARSQGQGRYDGSTWGTAEASTTGLYPWLGYRLNERVSVWSVTGWSAGSLQLTTGTATPLEHGLSTRMAAAGTRGELIGSSHRNGFRLAFKADALWVGTSVAGAEAGHDGHQDGQSTVTRLRTAIEASRELTVLGRMALAPSVEIGLRHDGGDAETGTGIDLSAGVAVTDQATGLSVDVRVRTLLAHQAVGYTSRGMSLSLGWDPTPSSPLGLTARVAPSWGAPDPSELWTSPAANHRAAYGPATETGRIDALLGYGLPVGKSLVGTPTVGFGSAGYGRNLRIGYGLRPVETGGMDLELGVETMLRNDPAGNGTDTGLAGQARVRW